MDEKTKREMLEKAIAVLNSAFEADPVAIQVLQTVMIPCNKKLAEHPTVVVRTLKSGKVDEFFTISPIGLLNGVLKELFDGIIAAKWTTDPEPKFLGFCVWEEPTKQ